MTEVKTQKFKIQGSPPTKDGSCPRNAPCGHASKGEDPANWLFCLTLDTELIHISMYENHFTLSLYKYVHFCNINIKDDIPEDYDYSHFEYINKVILSVFNFTISSLRFHKEMAGIF